MAGVIVFTSLMKSCVILSPILPAGHPRTFWFAAQNYNAIKFQFLFITIVLRSPRHSMNRNVPRSEQVLNINRNFILHYHQPIELYYYKQFHICFGIPQSSQSSDSLFNQLSIRFSSETYISAVLRKHK